MTRWEHGTISHSYYAGANETYLVAVTWVQMGKAPERVGAALPPHNERGHDFDYSGHQQSVFKSRDEYVERLGAQGWELVAVTERQGLTLFFKRQVET